MASYSKLTAPAHTGLRTGWTFAVLRQAVTAWRHRARARRALGKLDAHMLRDIGLSPLDANRECARHFWQD